MLRKTSQFWVTSGLGVDVGLTGLHLNADSLSSIVRGGVSFATPTVSEDPSPVQSGQMYVLHEKPDPGWLSSATSLPLIDFSLPPTVMLHGTRKTTMLGIPRTQKFSMNALVVRRDSATLELLTASDALPAAATAENASGSSAEFRIESPLTDFAATTALQRKTVAANDAAAAESIDTYSWLIGNDLKGDLPATDPTNLRLPAQPEDCCVCRSVRNDGIATSVIQSISRDQMTSQGSLWSVALDTSDVASWHGAPVVAMADGKVIGLFLATKSGAMIAILR